MLRYGSLHGTVLGLEVVLADGTIVNTMSGCRKDNTGYDLKQLFIGAEGTLGLVTGVSIQVPRKPKAVNVALLAAESYDGALQIMAAAKTELGEILSACELMDAASMVVNKNNLDLDNPLSEQPFYVLLETHGSNDTHDKEKLDVCLENAMTEGFVVDGIIAQDQTQIGEIWNIRESITEACKGDGVVYKYDVSLPVTKLFEIVEIMKERTEGVAITVCGFGHMGDGNLHLNITGPADKPELLDLIEPFVYEYTASVGGSISAEHGIGVMKPTKLHYSKSSEAIQMMQLMKKTLDPKGILNPYKTILLAE